MKISILAPNLSSNSVGRAYLLAKILQRKYKLEIIGPIWGDEIWNPVKNDKSITYKFVNIDGRLKPYWQLQELFKKISGDIIYASKPIYASFGLGLLKKFIKRKPLILDIDDWQMGIIKENYSNFTYYHRLKFWISSALLIYQSNSYWNNLIGEKLTPLADEITISNTFLKKKFGGTTVWHGRDTEAFNPAKFNKNLAREKYGIEKKKKAVMFFGTARPHKGIEDLIKATSIIKNQDVILVIVGLDDKNQYCIELIKAAGDSLHERFRGFGLQPFEKVPEILIMADVIVVPQKRNFATVGQIPAKIFDAMAMAKSIIATDVSDIPEILNGCGWIVEPGNAEQLAQTIQYVLNNPDEADEMAQKARKKCIDKYSWEAMEKVLLKLFEKYE